MFPHSAALSNSIFLCQMDLDKPTHVSSILEIIRNSSILLELYLCPYLVIICHQAYNHTHLLFRALKYCQWPVVIFLLKSFHFLDLLISFMHHSCSPFLYFSLKNDWNLRLFTENNPYHPVRCFLS